MLALEPTALLVRWTISGTLRAEGGAFEQQFLLSWAFGADGRVARNESFDLGREAEALARFDEFGAPVQAARVTRRVRPNAATANAARVDAAIAARDTGTLEGAFAQHADVVHHPTGAVFDQRGVLGNWRTLLGASDVRFATTPIATLGDSLALCHGSVSFGSMVADADTSFGAVSKDEFILIEVDARGRRTRLEFFATNRLGDAIARLYDRYADLQPAGRTRDVAERVARAMRAMLEAPDLELLSGRSLPRSSSSTSGPWEPGPRGGGRRR